MEEREKLLRIMKSDAFKLYNKNLDEQISYLVSNVMDINSTANEIQFSRHDLYRMLIKILLILQKEPLTKLETLLADFQQDPAYGKILEDNVEYMKKIIYGSEGKA